MKTSFPPAGLHVALSRGQILQTQAKEGSVSSERHVPERAHALRLLEHALPVRLDGDGARRVLAVEVSVQDVYGLLVHRRLKFTGKECGTGQLLSRRKREKAKMNQTGGKINL